MDALPDFTPIDARKPRMVKSIHDSVWKAAKEAADRDGLNLNEWIENTLSRAAREQTPNQVIPRPEQWPPTTVVDPLALPAPPSEPVLAPTLAPLDLPGVAQVLGELRQGLAAYDKPVPKAVLADVQRALRAHTRAATPPKPAKELAP